MGLRKKRGLKTVGCIVLALLLAVGSLPFSGATALAAAEPSVTLLFTTDIHSNNVPHLAMIDGKGGRFGGFARLKTAIAREYVAGQTLLLDSGDFSMGTLYQNYTQSDALELSLMDALGYDAVALGNHDFELGEDGLRAELSTFRGKGGKLALLASNLTDGSGKVASEKDVNPLAEQGVQNYAVLERNGVRVGIFSIMGADAISYTPVSSFSFADPLESARAMVARLREVEKVDLVVALSHSGILPDGSFHEDADIAAAVSGIDVILSGHEHVALPELVRINDTLIVCAGTALDYLGKLVLTRAEKGWSGDYKLLPLSDDVSEDAETAAILADYTERIDAEYLAPMGVAEKAMDDFAASDYDFPDGDHMALKLQNYAFGELIADAYFDGLKKAGVSEVTGIAVPVGFVRNGLYKGKLQVMDVYNALSYGISPLDGSSGAPICAFWLTGREIYDICETSVSLSGLMNTVQMLLGGVRFEYSASRLPLNRVYSVSALNRATGAYEPIARDESKLYKVAVSWTALQNLSLLGSKSYGLLSVEPKDENGVIYAADELKKTVVLRADGKELKEWFALYDYIDSMPVNAEGLHEIDARYAGEPSYMTEKGGDIGLFFQNPSKAFWVICGIALVALLLVALLVLLIVKLVRRGRRRSAARKAAQTTTALLLVFALLLAFAGCSPAAAKDPLASWNDGAAKMAITEFVTAAVTEGGEGFIPVADRLVVSDMDGTLICESGGATGSEYAEIELIRCFVESERAGSGAGDIAARQALADYDAALAAEKASGGASSPQLDDTDITKYYYELIGRAFDGLTMEEAQSGLLRQLDKPYAAGRSFRQAFYEPMLELYQYLRDNGFTFYVVSGSNRNMIYTMCMEALAHDGEPYPYALCLGAEQEVKLSTDGLSVEFTEKMDKLNVNALKCSCIVTEIGKKPVLALGNSIGDREMLSWTLGNGEYKTLALLVNHDDAAREAAYRAEELRALCASSGYLCVSMKDDFARVYGD